MEAEVRMLTQSALLLILVLNSLIKMIIGHWPLVLMGFLLYLAACNINEGWWVKTFGDKGIDLFFYLNTEKTEGQKCIDGLPLLHFFGSCSQYGPPKLQSLLACQKLSNKTHVLAQCG